MAIVSDRNGQFGGTDKPVSFQFTGKGAEFFPIWLVNILLSIVTIGIWRFWATTRVRKYVWSHIHLDGDAFEWVGTGGELFKGFLIAFVLFLLPTFLLLTTGQILLPSDPLTGGLLFLAGYLGALYFVGAAVYRAQRYRMTRTLWRGIRGNMEERGWKFGAYYFLFLLGSVFTLGLLIPLLDTWQWRYQFNRKSFGNKRFSSNAKAIKLYGAFVLFLLAVIGLIILAVAVSGFALIPTSDSDLPDPAQVTSLIFFLFIIYAGIPLLQSWYIAVRYRILFAATAFDGVPLRFRLSGLELFGFTLVNMLLVVFTLGLAYPWVLMRICRLAVTRVEVSGSIALDTLEKSGDDDPRTGEGLADVFDVGSLI